MPRRRWRKQGAANDEIGTKRRNGVGSFRLQSEREEDACDCEEGEDGDCHMTQTGGIAGRRGVRGAGIGEEEKGAQHADGEGGEMSEAGEVGENVNEHEGAAGLVAVGQVGEPEGLEENGGPDEEGDVDEVEGLCGVVAREDLEQDGEDEIGEG